MLSKTLKNIVQYFNAKLAQNYGMAGIIIYAIVKLILAKIREIYPGGIYKSTPTIFEKSEEIHVFALPKDLYYPYFACYDFESFFDHNNLPKKVKCCRLGPAIDPLVLPPLLTYLGMKRRSV